MEHTLVIINAIAYLAVCVFFIKKYGVFNPATIIWEFITLTAVIGIPAYLMLSSDFFFSRYDFSNVTLIPFIFLFVMNVCFIKPIFFIPQKIKNTPINYKLSFLKNFSYFYILCSIVSIYLNYRLFQTDLANAEWNDIRESQYAGEALMAYNNIFERFFISITSHLRLVACIVFMILFIFHKKKTKNVFLIVFAVSIIVPVFMDAMRTASRGMIISIVFYFAFLIGIFWKYIDKKQMMAIGIAAAVFLFFAYGYSMAVTTSRFDDTSGNISALICYWGQPQIIFNSAVAGITDCWGGQYAFGNIYELLGVDVNCSDADLGTRFTPCFTTIVGNLYCDFLFVGPLLFAVFIWWLMRMIKKKKVITIADIYLVYYICLELQHGALVMRSNYLCDVSVWLTIIIYILLNKISIKKEAYA